MAYAAITSGINQEKGITYSGTTDNSGDWTGVPNSTYFYDKATDLAYYKDSSGVVLSIFVAAVDSLYTADGTLSGNRTVNLDSNNLTLTGGTANFEFGGSWQGFTRWDSSGAVQIKSNGNTDPFKIYKKVDASNPNFVSKSGGGGHLGTDGNHWTVSETYGSTSTRIEVDNTYIKQYHGSGLQHSNKLGGASTGVHFFQAGIPGSLGYFIVGGNTRIGTEKISLQEDTLISKKLELSTTTDGFLMPRLTTAQMNAISSPDTHLLIFNTDLNALYRYNGTTWVAMASGYGVIEVIKDSDNGNPTFYSDLQSALETCKTAGSSNTINIYSNITITSTININRGGSGVGNGYQYKNLTIDFNGFTLTNNEADSSYCFDISFGNIASENRQITFKNGIINRTSGTGTHYTLHCDETENDGHLIMSNMRWYCENSNSVRLEIDELDSSYKDFGGSVFESDGGTPLRLQHYSAKNFTCIGNSSSGCLSITSGARATNFEVENTSTGDGIDIGGDSDVSFFKVKTTSGIGIDCSDDCQGVFTNFYIETTTGDGIDTLGTNATYKLRFSNFEIRCDNGICIDSNHRNTFFSNFTLSNNGSSYTISTSSNTHSTFSNGTAINYGSGQVVGVGNTNNVNFRHVDFISKGGSVGTIGLDNSAYSVYFENCTFDTEFDDAAGVNLTITNSTGTIVLTTCSFKVVNNSANCIYATSTKTISLSNSNFKGATTPINSNVTLSNTFTSDPYGNITI
tara:strand:- start:351 stop:2573 length:2223 start_codon:yes stop_codon:yes gene_type:complete